MRADNSWPLFFLEVYIFPLVFRNNLLVGLFWSAPVDDDIVAHFGLALLGPFAEAVGGIVQLPVDAVECQADKDGDGNEDEQ